MLCMTILSLPLDLGFLAMRRTGWMEMSVSFSNTEESWVNITECLKVHNQVQK